MRLTWLADELRSSSVLRQLGVRVVEVEGWRTRGPEFPATGPAVFLYHHTASGRRSGPTGGLRIVVHGRPASPGVPALAGPIANLLLARTGDVYVLASGVSNNAGRGNARAAGMPGVTGNASTIAVEMENDGVGEPYSQTAYAAAAEIGAVVGRRMRWGAARFIGHKEWSTSGKIDPTLSMPALRARIGTAIVASGNRSPSSGARGDKVYARVGVTGKQTTYLTDYMSCRPLTREADIRAKRELPLEFNGVRQDVASEAALEAEFGQIIRSA